MQDEIRLLLKQHRELYLELFDKVPNIGHVVAALNSVLAMEPTKPVKQYGAGLKTYLKGKK